MWLCLNGACGTVNPDSATTCTVCGSAGLQLRLFKPGTMVGAYEIRRFVGHGGYGVVYEAARREEDGSVLDIALKQTSLADYRMLERELNLLEGVSHPNLPVYFEAFQHGGSGYLAMEFVQGLNLRELLTHAGGALGEKQVVQYALELCGAVAALHHNRPPLLHRDIKPANIRLTPQGRIKLVDFGLTKVGTEMTRTTQEGATLGYAPWEQLTATGKTDERSDIYSMGATLYHLLTNEVPASSVERGINGEDALIPPDELNPALHPDVVKIILKAMERRQESRYQSVAEMESALRRVAGAIAVAGAPKSGPRSSGKARSSSKPREAPVPDAPRFPLVPVLLGLAGVLLAVAVGVSQFAGATDVRPTAVVVATDAPPTPVPPTATEGPGEVVLGSDTPVVPPTRTPADSATATEIIVVADTETPPTATRAPTSTPIPLPRFMTLPMAPVANGLMDFVSPPEGVTELGGIPFDISRAIFKSQADVDPHRIAPTEARLDTSVPGATRLHILINTGNGKPQYDGDVVGRVFVTCGGVETDVQDLVLGQTIREWHNDEGVVITAWLPLEVYEGPRTDNSERRGHIDMLSIVLPEACRAGLTSVTVRDTSAETAGSLDPALNWFGATVEYLQP